MQLRDGKILKLISLYEQGDISARNVLLEMNYELIKEKAYLAYNLLTDKIKKYYNIDNNNYILPDYIINVDDILQDFNIQSLYIIDHYITKKTNEYLSSYLNQRLSSYINIYTDIWYKKIILKENNEFHQTIKLTQIEKEDILIKEIKFMFKNDSVLIKHEKFINMILDGCTIEELKKETGLDKRRIGMKIKYLAEEYTKRKKYLNLLYKIEEENIYKMIKNGKIYELPFYKEIIDNCIIETMKKITLSNNKDNINYSDIYNYYIEKSNKIIKNYFKKHEENIIAFNEYFIPKINSYKGKNKEVILNNYKEKIKKERKGNYL